MQRFRRDFHCELLKKRSIPNKLAGLSEIAQNNLMIQTFNAKSVVTENSHEEESFIVGFMDDEKNPSEFILFQRAFEFDEQDEETGLAGHWFEYKDQAYGDYKACQSVTISKNEIKIQIAETSKNIFSEFSGFQVHFDITNENLNLMIDTMKSIFQDNPEILHIEV